MKNLSNFLQKFTLIRDPSLDKERISSVIKEQCGIEILPSQIQFKKTLIQVSAHSALKSALFFKKTSVLNILIPLFPERGILDIQ